MLLVCLLGRVCECAQMMIVWLIAVCLCGQTIKCFENNPLVRQTLEEPGDNRVLVVDGGGSTCCALLGDNLANIAHTNQWAGDRKRTRMNSSHLCAYSMTSSSLQK